MGRLDASDEELVPPVGTCSGEARWTIAAASNFREDIPQAFSSFSCQVLKEKYLVCDLGCPGSDEVTALFRLTDPVIHYRSTNNRKNVFDTDEVIGNGCLFNTHMCSELCHALGAGSTNTSTECPQSHQA